MVKKIAFGVLVAAAVLCGTWGYFYLQQLKKPAHKPYDVLPDSCFALLEIKDLTSVIKQLKHGNLLWEEGIKIADVAACDRIITLLDSLSADEEAFSYLVHEPFYIALYSVNKQPCALYAFNLSDINASQAAGLFFEKNFNAKQIRPGLYSCTTGAAAPSFYLSINAGLVLACTNQEYLEKVLASDGSNVLNLNSKFGLACATVSKSKGLSVFLHEPYYRNYAHKNLFTFAGNDLFYGEEDRWIPSDVTLEPADVNLEGFLPNDSSRVCSVVKNQDPDDFNDLFEKIPYGTFYLEAVNISNYGDFCRDNYSGNVNLRKQHLQKYSDSLSANAQAELSELIGNFGARLRTLIYDSINEFGVIQVSDASRAKQFMERVADSTLVKSDTANMYLIADAGLFTRIMAGYLDAKYEYAMLSDEQLVFSNSRDALAEFKRSVTEQANFMTNERARNFISRNFNIELNYLCYRNFFKDRDAIYSSLGASVLQRLDENPGLFENLDAAGLAIQRIKGQIFYKWHVGYNPKNKLYQNTLWETVLDTVLVGQPVVMVNHKTGENEMACLDELNKLYLMSNTGKILWKKQLSERVLGKPVQVDYFANGKLQMLFASPNFIHLIDRNGNYVEGFPIKIRVGASGGISVFDYEGKKEYRMWIPLKSNMVICLNMACKAVEGFQPLKVKAPVTGGIKHLMIQQKDYFIITDTLGNVYVTNRKGELRQTISHKVMGYVDQPFFIEGKDVSKTFIASVECNRGVLQKISLTDQEQISTLKGAQEATTCFMDTLQINPLQVVIGKDKELKTMDLFGNAVLQAEVPSEIKAGTSLLFGNNKVYALLDKEESTLLLYHTRNKTVEETGIKLDALPVSSNLIKGKGHYLLGYYRNKVFCIKP